MPDELQIDIVLGKLDKAKLLYIQAVMFYREITMI
jgi:hypothetical protein